MQKFCATRYYLLALSLAVVQLFLPLAAYAHLVNDGGFLQEICTSSGHRTLVDNGTSPDQPGGSAVDHAAHCAQCCHFAVLPGPISLATPPQALPQGTLKIGHIWFQAGSPVVGPPATGPPHSA